MALIDIKSISGIITLVYAVIYGFAGLVTSIKSAIDVKDINKKRKQRLIHSQDNRDDDSDYDDETNRVNSNSDLKYASVPKDEETIEAKQESPNEDAGDAPQKDTENEPEVGRVETIYNPTDDIEEEKEQINRTNTVAVAIKPDAALEFHTKLERSLSKAKAEDTEASVWHANPVVFWAKLVYAKKRVYLGLFPHIFDQATDFGVMVEYYRLYATTREGEQLGSMNPFYLFWISVLIIVSARIISTVTVWVVTENWKDTLLQSMDLLIMKAVFISYQIDAQRPTTMQRYLLLLEAIFETSPQMVLSMVFVLKSTDTNSIVSPVIYLSLVTSIASLVFKVVSDDRMIFQKAWENVDFKFKVVKNKLCCKKWKAKDLIDGPNKTKVPPPLLNGKYILRAILRFLEITARLCILTLTWVVIGGFSLLIIMFFEFCILSYFCVKLKKPDPLGMIIYSWFKIRRALEKQLKYFHYYRVGSSFLYLLIITIFIFVDFEAWKVEEAEVRYQNSRGFGLFMLIYGWIVLISFLAMWWFIEKKMDGISWGGRVVRDPGELARGYNFLDLAELFEFGCTHAYTKDSAWWTAWKLLDRKCEMQLFVRIAPHLIKEHPNIWNYLGPYKRTPLMECYWETKKIKYIVSKFSENVDLSVKSKNRDDEGFDFRKYVREKHQFTIMIRGEEKKSPRDTLSDEETKSFLKFVDVHCKK